MPAASCRSPPPANRPSRRETGFVRRNRGPQALERSLAEKLLQRPGDRRADGPQFVVALTQPLVGRQARHERAPAPFIELVVDQSDKFGVFVSHRLTGERSYFSFASVARAAASLLMTVPIGTARAAAASA